MARVKPPRMKPNTKNAFMAMVVALTCSAGTLLATTNLTEYAASGSASSLPKPPSETVAKIPDETLEQSWNWHVQNTDIVQGDTGFPAKYSGPNSLDSQGELRETVSLDLFAGARLWRGAEAHVDGLVWQGYGLSQTLGIKGVPNGEAFRLGTKVPNVTFARLFIRQTIGFGGDQEEVPDSQLTLAGKQDISRLTLTLGKMNIKDIFDNTAYANDPRTQFMNWGLMANEAWDYPADSIGYMTGFAAELNQPHWALRYGFFQMPRVSNGMAQDAHYLEAWGMVTELERRYALQGHPGTIRVLAYLNHAHMGSYQEAINNPTRPADILATREYRFKYGFGLNVEQEIIKHVAVFSRLGWSDGQHEAWTLADVDRTATLGLSIKGGAWRRRKPNQRAAVTRPIGIEALLNYLRQSEAQLVAG